MVFENVSFAYADGTHVLTDINLTVEPGQMVALVGQTGSGKSTMASLLPRFYDPDSGQILIDGCDIREVTLRSLREQIGMVTQQTITFNDTIRANITYGRRGAGEEETATAAKRAFAHDFISKLP